MLKRNYLKILCILSIGVFILLPEYINAFASFPESNIDIVLFYTVLIFYLIIIIDAILDAVKIKDKQN